MLKVREKLETVLTSGSVDNRRPALKKANESNIKGLHIIGDLAGAPVIKLAMAQAVELVDYLSTLPEMQELLLDAGFASTEVYVEGWDDEEDEADGIFRKRSYFENQAGWVAYVVGHADS